MLIILRRTKVQAPNPGQPQKVMWILSSAGTGEILNQTFQMITPWTWWPDLMFDFCDLVHGSWEVGDWILGIERRPECEGSWEYALPQASYPNECGCSHILRGHGFLQTPFYVCQGSNWTATSIRNCRATPDYYCYSRGCELNRLDIISKDRDCITLFTKVFGFFNRGNLTN